MFSRAKKKKKVFVRRKPPLFFFSPLNLSCERQILVFLRNVVVEEVKEEGVGGGRASVGFIGRRRKNRRKI